MTEKEGYCSLVHTVEREGGKVYTVLQFTQ